MKRNKSVLLSVPYIVWMVVFTLIPLALFTLALLLWQTAGKPEPAAQPAFADVADADMAKAAQWCVEQGLLDAREGKFESDGWMPKFKTIEIWNKAFPKK